MSHDRDQKEHNRLEQASELVEAVDTFISDFGPLVDAAAGVFELWKAALEPAFRDFEPILDRLTKLLEAVAPHIEKLARHHRIERRFGNAGWLPYYSDLIARVDEHEGDASALDNIISEYYRDHWAEIRKDIEDRMETYSIDGETKQTVHEAFSAHESGNYRSVCRTLFPELERVIRRSFFNDAGRIRTADMLRVLADKLAVGEILSREGFCLITIGRHVQHMYAQVDEGARHRFEQSSIPNRHAALHGLVSYSTHKHSVNMIIISDYLFQILPPKAVDPGNEHAEQVTADAPW